MMMKWDNVMMMERDNVMMNEWDNVVMMNEVMVNVGMWECGNEAMRG